jgi:hypothetical protein
MTTRRLDPPRPLDVSSLEMRRARRQARREKQRQANSGRALKMRAARLTSGLEPHGAAPDLPAFNVGCSGWFY